MSKFEVEAAVHMEIPNGGFRVKVSVPNLGLYINGIMVFPPSGKHTKWGVLTPQGTSKSGKRFRQLEFAKQSLLWIEIEAACVAAVKYYTGETETPAVSELADLNEEEFSIELRELDF